MRSKYANTSFLRLTFYIAAFIYVAWYFVLNSMDGILYNPLRDRLYIAALFLTVAFLSYRIEWIEKHLQALVTFGMCLLTAHYFYMFHRNAGDERYIVGTFITVATIHAFILSKRSAEIYAVFSVALAAWITWIHPPLRQSVLLSGLITLLVISQLVMRNRLRLLNEVQKGKERFQSLFDNSFQGLLLADHGTIVDVNDTMSQLLGASRDELIGRNVLEFTAEAERPALEYKIMTGFEGTHETVLKRVNGEEILVEVAVKAHTENGKDLRLAAVQDIRDRKRAEHERVLFRAAQESIRIRDEFIAVASHELKTPLTPLLLQLETALRMPGALQGETPKLIEGAHRQVMRLSHLVNELLDASRLNSGQLELHPIRSDLAQVTRETAESFVAQARNAGAEVRIEAPGPIMACFDRLRIEQVLSNLIRNAITFSERRPIEIKIIARPEKARIEVRDHGIGISKDIQERIFDRFERGVPSRNYGGLGLGLYIARKIVSAHEGQISVQSAPGQGSTFSVDIPLDGPKRA